MNAYTYFSRAFEARRSRPCLVVDDGATYTYADLERETARVAAFLTGLGLRKGDRVAAQVDKSPQALFLYLGTLRGKKFADGLRHSPDQKQAATYCSSVDPWHRPEDRTGGGTTVNWTWPTTANAGAIAIEVKAVASPIVPSAPASDAETLAKQFEPILFFSANERFFPADAKRYVEHCALWRAQAPFDVKDSWGGKGGTFPRAPIIVKTAFSFLSSEASRRNTSSCFTGLK